MKNTYDGGSIVAEEQECYQGLGRPMTSQEAWVSKHGEAIAPHLPYEFPNGSFVLTSYELCCPKCSHVLPIHMVRGLFSQINDDVLIIRAMGWCPDCVAYLSTVTRYRCVDGTCEVASLSHDDGWARTKFSRKNPIRSFFSRFFKRSKTERVVADV